MLNFSLTKGRNTIIWIYGRVWDLVILQSERAAMVNRMLCIMLIVAGTWLFSSIPAHAQSPSIVAQVQQRLIERGYHPGPVDGSWGPRTASELRRYQADNRLPVTGDLNTPTLRSLNISPEPTPTPPPPPYPDYRDSPPGPPRPPGDPRPPIPEPPPRPSY